MKQRYKKRYGALTVLEEAGVDKNQEVLWRCKCECGKECLVPRCRVVRGSITSCGCRINRNREHAKSYGSAKSTEKRYWKGPYSNSTSGVRGVHYDKEICKWKVNITHKRKTRYLGSFDNLEDAFEARKNAEARILRELRRAEDESAQ